MPEGDDRLLPLSALQHMVFCDRQAALIHVEGVWADNRLTVEGQQLHHVVDAAKADRRDGVMVRRSVSLRSDRLGLVGKADVIEFHPTTEQDGGSAVPGMPGHWRVVPVEYKRGKPKPHRADEVQLCAQAICLEEALGVDISAGALFYGAIRRRQHVELSQTLRNFTEHTATRLRGLVASGDVPVRPRTAKCKSCSLLDICLPLPRRAPRSARTYLESILGGCGPHP